MTNRTMERAGQRTHTPPQGSIQKTNRADSNLRPSRAHQSGPWTEEQIPDQSGRVAVITGSNSGIGYEAARALAAKGAQVILAVRSESRGAEAQAAIRERVPHALVEVRKLDLADLASVEAFAQRFTADYPRLDLLINNAGVMGIPYRRSADGFELQFATNHLGHFALTGHLLPHLLETGRAQGNVQCDVQGGVRIVTVSSMVHQGAQLDFDNLNSHQSYGPWRAYQASKLANLHFAYALHDKLNTHQTAVRSVACHPGYTATNLQTQGLTMDGGPVHRWLVNAMNRLFAQKASMGALPTLYAAAAETIHGGEYVGPDGVLGVWGHPTIARSSRQSYDRAAAQRLWAISESLTGVRYPLE